MFEYIKYKYRLWQKKRKIRLLLKVMENGKESILQMAIAMRQTTIKVEKLARYFPGGPIKIKNNAPILSPDQVKELRKKINNGVVTFG